MGKTRKIDVRVSADEYAEIERFSKTLKVSKSDYVRMLLTGSIPQNQPVAPPAPADDSRKFPAVPPV